MPDDDDKEDVSGQPFSIDERKELRRLMLSEARAKWAWKQFRYWIGWIGATISALWIGGEWAIEKFNKVFTIGLK